ncbi:MAG: PIN domain-containing protein [Acidobacteria bacterium]|nr:PIN domain-containing protein [Acidobacteriota bacterium]
MNADRVFFDTNILVYCFDRLDTRKRDIAHALVLEHGVQESGVISHQVQNEFVSVAIRHLKDPAAVKSMVAGFELLFFGLQIVPHSQRFFYQAITLWERYTLAWYDSLIIAAALEGRCGVLYSEDLQDGLVIDGMQIVNPFRH